MWNWTSKNKEDTEAKHIYNHLFGEGFLKQDTKTHTIKEKTNKFD